MYEKLLIIFFIFSFFLILLIIIYPSNSTNVQSSFQNKNIEKLFILKDSKNYLSKFIGILAFLFFFMSLILNNIYQSKKSIKSKWENLVSKEEKTVIKKSITNDIPK